MADVAASFQEAVVDVLTRKAVRACQDLGADTLLIGGGVAANSRLRVLAEERAAAAGIRVRVPRPKLCTDNGAMVAALGAELVRRGRTPSVARLPGRQLAARRGGGGLMARSGTGADPDVGGPVSTGPGRGGRTVGA